MKKEITKVFFTRLRRAKRIFFSGCLFYLPMGSIGSFVLGKIDYKLEAVWPSSMIIFLIIYGSWMFSFKCPRCGKKYFVRDYFPYKSLFTKKCVHCSLEQPYDDEPFFKKSILLFFFISFFDNSFNRDFAFNR